MGCDLFVNVAGGMQLSEPACDLAVCAALVSSLQNRPMDPQTLVLGEVGLAGEVRRQLLAGVGRRVRRVRRAAQHQLGERPSMLAAGRAVGLHAAAGGHPDGPLSERLRALLAE